MATASLPSGVAAGHNEMEALANGPDAYASVVSAPHDMGCEVPAPSFIPDTTTVTAASGKFVTRVAKSIHAKLTARAKAEGVSLNTLGADLHCRGFGAMPVPGLRTPGRNRLRSYALRPDRLLKGRLACRQGDKDRRPTAEEQFDGYE
jgi:hypothetical protein